MAEAAGDTDANEPSIETLRVERELLAAENERLREAYAATKRTTYRTTALGLAAVGLVAVVGGLVLPSAREVLFALGATGLFGAILTVYVTPERFVAADVGRSTYAAMADSYAALSAELGLAETHHYVPTNGDVRLFVPQAGVTQLPDAEALEATLVATDSARGLAVEPTGARLLQSLAPAGPGDLAGEPDALVPQLTEALVEQFELVRSAEPDRDPDGGRLTVAVRDSAYGPVDRFDHPVASVLATGLARGLERPVELTVDADGSTYRVTCRWEPT